MSIQPVLAVRRGLAALFLIIAGLPAPAQTGEWASDCADAFCVFQNSLDTGQGVFAVVEILINVETGAASIVVTTPLGIALEPGVLITLEGHEWQAPLKVCEADGCRATVDLTADEFGLLLSRPGLELRYIVFGSERPDAATLELSGLVAAISRSRN